MPQPSCPRSSGNASQILLKQLVDGRKHAAVLKNRAFAGFPVTRKLFTE